MNRSSTCFLSVPSRRDQLFYFITFCRFCQVNILWTEAHSIFSFLFPRQPVQNSQPIHSTTLQAFCQVNFSWTSPTANCRSPDPFHGFCYSQVSLTFALVRQLYYYITLLLLCQVENCKEYGIDFIYFAHMHSVYSKTGSGDTPPKPVSSYSYSCSHLSSFSAIRFKYASQAAACCFVRFVSDTISP